MEIDENLIKEVDEMLLDFSCLRNKICFKLINAEKNRELLKEIPHLPFCDLAVVFYLLLKQDESGQLTTLIQNKHMHMWGLTLEEVSRLASENTTRMMPAVLELISEVLKKIEREELGENVGEERTHELPEEQLPMYVLTNEKGFNGAGAMLYPSVLEQAAQRIGGDLLILPSSVHEVILLKAENRQDWNWLREMVCSINAEDVPEEDVLSDNIYLFERHIGKVRVVTDGRTLYT